LDNKDIDAMFSVRSSFKAVVAVSKVREEWESVSGEAKLVRWATFFVNGVLWAVVGNGKVTSPSCGKYSGLKVCLNVDLHGQRRLDGGCNSGKIFRRIIHFSCGRPLCPECYVNWALRSARKVAFILGEASKQFGKVEHVIVSVPPEDYGLDFEELRRKCIKVLFSRGVIGGSLIFHGARFNRIRGWYWSPHFHSLAFVFGGYKCRGCERKNNCLKGCGGLDDVNWQKYQVDRWYVKIADSWHGRKSVRRTASYELGHCTVKADVRHFRVVTYFGVCSYRKLKIDDVARARFEAEFNGVCPLCSHELKDGFYCGVKPLVTDRKSPDFKRDSVEDFLQNGFPAYGVKEEG